MSLLIEELPEIRLPVIPASRTSEKAATTRNVALRCSAYWYSKVFMSDLEWCKVWAGIKSGLMESTYVGLPYLFSSILKSANTLIYS